MTWPEIARRLLLHARALGAPAEEAEDLVHDALETLVRDPDWYDPDRGTVLGALKVVLKNRYLNRIRSQGVRSRAAPHLRVVEPEALPDGRVDAAMARDCRRRLIALLEPDERSLFAAWIQQRSGALHGPEAARSVGMSPAGYEAAKKRLRRRCRALLEELGLEPSDLFGPAVAIHTGEGG